MECKKAEKYIMKYMDNELSEEEAKVLNSHIMVCDFCKNDFYIYDNILNELNILENFEAPIDFENSVISKIEKLIEREYNKYHFVNNTITSVILLSFSIFFSIITLLILFRGNIITYFLNNSYISEQGQIIKQLTNNTFFVVNSTILNSIGILFGLLAIICVLQFIFLKRKKHTK